MRCFGYVGTAFQSGGGPVRLRWVDTGGDTGQPTHVSSSQAGYDEQGCGFDALPAEECPEGHICVDPEP